ncbi:MAG: methylmalonyl-CoA epimerase [Flavobacteriaceae bacterium]|nr:methylmalonyl-CoA epimerase [Flavobacteriaceae bacterium]
MKKIEHIGIAVKDLESSKKIFSKLLGIQPYKDEVVLNQNVKTSFFKIRDTKIELLASLNEKSTISRFINNNGQGLHHIAFEVENIENEIIRLKKEGFKLISEIPENGADNKRFVFLYPKSTNGVLIELCQEIS